MEILFIISLVLFGMYLGWHLYRIEKGDNLEIQKIRNCIALYRHVEGLIFNNWKMLETANEKYVLRKDFWKLRKQITKELGEFYKTDLSKSQSIEDLIEDKIQYQLLRRGIKLIDNENTLQLDKFKCNY